MITKPPHQVMVDDLRTLVDNVREGKSIEFKREMPARSHDEKIKFLAAVSSFANTVGGDLIVGLDAIDGIAHSITGVQIPNLDDEKLRLEQLLATCIEPRLPPVDIAILDVGENRHAIVIRVPRSWIAPHRVTLNDKFYGRNSAGKYPLDVSELRGAFVQSETAIERIRAFRTDRLMRIAADQTPVLLHPGGRLVVHAVPISTVATGRMVDIVQEMEAGHVMPLPPGRMGHANDYRPNLDGLVTYTNAGGGPAGGYAQVFRNGGIEGVDVLHVDDKTKTPYLNGPTFEAMIVDALRFNYMKFIKAHDLGYPVVVLVSLCSVLGCYVRTRSEFGSRRYDNGSLTDNVIALPEVVIESDATEVAGSLRPIFNQIWNAFGFMGSTMYDQAGQWKGRA